MQKWLKFKASKHKEDVRETKAKPVSSSLALLPVPASGISGELVDTVMSTLGLETIGSSHWNTPPAKGAVISLPEDLEREIFELSVVQDRRSAFRLMLVARRVHAWIEPIIYTSLQFDRPGKQLVQRKANQILTYKTDSFLARNVKAISVIADHLECEEILHLLTICTGLTSLAYWSTRLLDSALVLQITINSLHLRHLAISFTHVFPGTSPDFANPAFSHLTHLLVLDLPAQWASWPWTHLALPPRLTHLAFDRWSYQAHAVSVLRCILLRSTGESLRYLVVLTSDARARDSHLSLSLMFEGEPRIVFVHPIAGIQEDWNDAARGGCANFWSLAERGSTSRIEYPDLD